MVRNFITSLVRIYSRFQSRASPLSEDARKKRTAAAVLILGVLLGFWAYGTSTTEARISWLREHAPSEAFWRKTLTDRGYLLVTDSNWWEKAPSEFPYRKPNSPNIWITENRRTLLRYGNTGWEAWGLQDSSPPTPDRHLWESLGYGWDAVDLFVQLELPLTRVAGGVKNRKNPWSDPRALHY